MASSEIQDTPGMAGLQPMDRAISPTMSLAERLAALRASQSTYEPNDILDWSATSHSRSTRAQYHADDQQMHTASTTVSVGADTWPQHCLTSNRSGQDLDLVTGTPRRYDLSSNCVSASTTMHGSAAARASMHPTVRWLGYANLGLPLALAFALLVGSTAMSKIFEGPQAMPPALPRLPDASPSRIAPDLARIPVTASMDFAGGFQGYLATLAKAASAPDLMPRDGSTIERPGVQRASHTIIDEDAVAAPFGLARYAPSTPGDARPVATPLANIARLMPGAASIVLVKGLPLQARLSRGKRYSNGIWGLTKNEAARLDLLTTLPVHDTHLIVFEFIDDRGTIKGSATLSDLLQEPAPALRLAMAHANPAERQKADSGLAKSKSPTAQAPVQRHAAAPPPIGVLPDAEPAAKTSTLVAASVPERNSRRRSARRAKLGIAQDKHAASRLKASQRRNRARASDLRARSERPKKELAAAPVLHKGLRATLGSARGQHDKPERANAGGWLAQPQPEWSPFRGHAINR